MNNNEKICSMLRFMEFVEGIGIDIPALDNTVDNMCYLMSTLLDNDFSECNKYNARNNIKELIGNKFIEYYDSGEHIHESILEELVVNTCLTDMFLYDEVYYHRGEKHRQGIGKIEDATTILEIKDRLFAIDWDVNKNPHKGRIFYQPYEVFKSETVTGELPGYKDIGGKNE